MRKNVQRWNRTIKTQLWKYFTKNATHKRIDLLQHLINKFNSITILWKNNTIIKSSTPTNQPTNQPTSQPTSQLGWLHYNNLLVFRNSLRQLEY